MHLMGMKEIAIHISRSEPTVLILIRDYGFPAKKVLGVWESDTELIKEWRLNQLEKNPNAASQTGKPKKKKRKKTAVAPMAPPKEIQKEALEE